ncbi:hypothetical protein O3M35_003504 [Rhynocoris fuscipes]|uniref:Uncharacterized protein n=1 Tax=Rhynocoris fuscipes TaxID=488301 RepID=A0AAW1CKL6_9HEMI
MIITALRNYNMNTNTMTTTPASATIITGKRRRRRKRNVIEEESLDELLLTLYNLAEGYVKYHNNDL